MIRRRVTLVDYEDLQAHWRIHPRADWLVAAYIKYKPPPAAVKRTRPDGSTVQAAGPAPPPTGAMASLFAALGGKPGQTVAMQ